MSAELLSRGTARAAVASARGCCSAHMGPRLPCKRLLQPDRTPQEPTASRQPAGYPVGYVPCAQQNLLRSGMRSPTVSVLVGELSHYHCTKCKLNATKCQHRGYLQGIGLKSPCSLCCQCWFATLYAAKSTMSWLGAGHLPVAKSRHDC